MEETSAEAGSACRERRALIEARGLTHRVADRVVLAAPDFTVAAGEHLLLLGPSGSGKTTLINILSGLITPTTGSVRVDGEVMSSLPPAARDALRRRTLSVVFQTLRLLPALTVRQNLSLAQHVAHGRTDAAGIAALLEQVGLSRRADARPRQLSQGEAQRAAIARALVTRPKLVIADEPTSALDDVNAHAVMDLMLASAESTGASLLIATHDSRVRGKVASVLELASPARARAA
jgi:putative ABC transport system ATP-binding protein